ncbi:acyl-CoA dehydrogenase family protein [Spongiibacter taiwanensis]|uniref:acyl-CoA dehydrogenase family protein n=1 Tax=Spongiibacter taiwanensis TaxID=1748242 RepID=UPI0020352895|nr:acyl-CoA dehydrogenase family protein [Spongiibacter taiwanensis]USA42776.1 acyl-CoA dehydrogenase family protein [Spongiibacter taiwanensis]
MSDSFRAELRQWLEANLPPSTRGSLPEQEIPWGGRHPEYPNPDTKLWLERMVARGFTAPTWAKQYGGAELSPEQDRILKEELQRLQARPALFSFGLWMLGPVLLEYGTDSQKAEFLPPIARGEIRWCQGYSEPGAGSDLASLSTFAEDCGDHWKVNGQKVWTSYADKADWIFCLVRTDKDAPKHKGISFLLIDMNSPGISTRPIKLISGNSPFCETFFDDVKVPKNQLVGKVNEGWEIAKKLLQYERQNVSAAAFGGDNSFPLHQVARLSEGHDQGPIVDPIKRVAVAKGEMREQALSYLVARANREMGAGRISALTSVVKVAAAEINQQRQELAVSLLGMDGLGWSGEQFDSRALKETRAWLRSKGNSIEGGTSEVNLNIIARHILRLPQEP